MVEKEDIKKTLSELGIKHDDTVIFHSSLKSFGVVDGGAETVIEAILEYLNEGTAVFPALRLKNFADAYKDWDINKTPSDAGLISETFRKRPGVLRSNQETHSVTAYGVNAEYITEGHTSGRLRIGMIGDNGFGYNSPWQKMYDLGGKVVMMGVTLVYNTFKHFAEYKFVNDVLDSIKDKDIKKEAEDKVARFDDHNRFVETEDWHGKIWPFHNGGKAQNILSKKGMCVSAKCGDSTFVSVKVREFCDFMYNEFLYRPEEWTSEGCTRWIKKYRPYLRPDEFDKQ